MENGRNWWIRNLLIILSYLTMQTVHSNQAETDQTHLHILCGFWNISLIMYNCHHCNFGLEKCIWHALHEANYNLSRYKLDNLYVQPICHRCLFGLIYIKLSLQFTSICNTWWWCYIFAFLQTIKHFFATRPPKLISEEFDTCYDDNKT